MAEAKDDNIHAEEHNPEMQCKQGAVYKEVPLDLW